MNTLPAGNGYNLARSNNASIFRRDAMVNASDRIIARTSLRATFTLPRNAAGPDAFKSASVRAPINAGSTVAARTRRFLIAREYSIPDVRPDLAFSNHVR